jgi:hypothetical protein
MTPPPHRPPLAALLGGLLVLALGAGVASRVLPEGRVAALPERERFVQRFREVTRPLGVELPAGEPRVRLTTSDEENTFAYRRLGTRAADWLTRHGRGMQVDVSSPAQWGEARGTLQLSFTARGEPWTSVWIPSSLTDYFSNRAPQPEAICGLLLRGGESTGEGRRWTGSNHVTTLTPILGAGEALHLQRFDIIGANISCARRPGLGRLAGERLPGELTGAEFAKVLLALLLPAATLLLFVTLALRGRIDLSNAIALSLAVLLTTLLGNWPGSPLMMLFQAIAAIGYAVWLLVLWSAAESWARVRLPGFTTSLDTLRRGRLGQRAGSALLAGFGAGAALAGARLLLFAAVTRLDGVLPHEVAARLPLLGFGSNPIGRATAWTGVLLLAMAAGHKLAGRWGLLLAPLAAGLASAPLELRPWVVQYAAAVGLSAALAWVFRRYGLTAAFSAALLAFVWPVALLSLQHADWMPATAATSTLLALAPLVLGVVGLRRDEAVERDPGAVPEFLRREEREKRLSYEMDLLARMQLGLLPQSLPRLPGYELTARSILATEAGGDLYDFLRDDRGRLWIAAGDVSGHGYSCAIAQASLKAALLSLVDGNASPAKVLERADRVLRGIVAGRQFATVCLVRLEEATGRIVLANAGHPFPLIAEPGRGARELELPGLPLGQGPPRRYVDHELQLPRGGVLLLHSDGLFEALDPAGQSYGFDRPRQILSEAAAWNAAEILERVLFDWRRHLGGAPPPDDTTLVVLKRG